MFKMTVSILLSATVLMSSLAFLSPFGRSATILSEEEVSSPTEKTSEKSQSSDTEEKPAFSSDSKTLNTKEPDPKELVLKALPVLYQTMLSSHEKIEEGQKLILEIKNTRVIRLKDHPRSVAGEDLSEIFKDMCCLIEFSIFTNDILMLNPSEYLPLDSRTVTVLKDGTMTCSRVNPLEAYRSRFFDGDYTEIVDTVTDLEDTFHGFLVTEKPENVEIIDFTKFVQAPESAENGEDKKEAESADDQGNGKEANDTDNKGDGKEANDADNKGDGKEANDVDNKDNGKETGADAKTEQAEKEASQNDDESAQKSIAIVLPSEDPLYLVQNIIEPASASEKKVVENAIACLKKEWQKRYKNQNPETSALQPRVEIRNVRVIQLKRKPVTSNGKEVSMLDGVTYIVDFLCFTNYYATEHNASYLYNTNPIPAVHARMLGRMEISGMSLFNLYTTRFFDFDYSGVVASIRDFGGQFNGPIFEYEDDKDTANPGKEGQTTPTEGETSDPKDSNPEQAAADVPAAETVYEKHRIQLLGGEFDLLDDEVQIYRLHVAFENEGDEPYLPFEAFQVRAFQKNRQREDLSDFGLPECAPLIQSVSTGNTVKADYLFEVDDNTNEVTIRVCAPTENAETLLEKVMVVQKAN